MTHVRRLRELLLRGMALIACVAAAAGAALFVGAVAGCATPRATPAGTHGSAGLGAFAQEVARQVAKAVGEVAQHESLPIAAQYQSSISACADNGQATLTMTAQRELRVSLTSGTGATVDTELSAAAAAADNTANPTAGGVRSFLHGYDGSTWDRLVNGGGVEAAALRVTIASDSTGVLSIDDNGGSLTIDNAQLSVVGGGAEATAMRVTIANDSTGVVSVDDNGGNISVDWAGTVPPIGAGTEAAALRVTVATDSTGVLSVDDNGGALTVDSAQLPAALGAAASAGSLSVTPATDAVGSQGGSGTVTATTTRVSLATNVPLPAGSNSIGTVDTELPTAAALADNAANPTAPLVGAALIAYDGATWDRVPNGGGVEAAALRVTVASDSTGVLSVDDNGSTLTVDAPAAAPVAVQLSDGAALQTAAALDTDTGVGTVTRVAMAIAAAASGGPVPVQGGGGTEDGALRVTVASDSTGVLSVDDNGASLTVDNAALSVTGGGLEATALRVTVASDSTGVLSIDDNAASLTVDSPQLPAALGGGVEAGAMLVTVASDSTGVLSVDDNAGSLTVDNAALSVTGGGLEATALRVTMASDSTGVLSVDDNGANISVDWAGTVPPIGAGTEAAALRVTVATDSTGVLSVDDNGAALTVDSAQLPAALGQTTMAASMAVTIASNQSAVMTDTELPAAAALADNAANPTTPTVGAALLAYDGATWDRVQNGAGTAAAAMRSTLASDDPAVVALQIVDDWDETNRAAVNLIASQAGITGGAGAVAANTPRMTLASDDPLVATAGATTGAAVTTDANGTLQQYLRGLVTTSATGCSVDVNAAIVADVDAAVGASSGLRLMGFSCRESAAGAAVATFQIVHGATVGGGTVIYVVELNPDESRSEWFGPRGIAVPNGISIDVVAGTMDVHPIYSDDVP